MAHGGSGAMEATSELRDTPAGTLLHVGVAAQVWVE